MSKESKAKPTAEQYQAYQAMYDFFNQELFDNRLPAIFLNFSGKARALGFFAPNRWNAGQQLTHEISLNPSHLRDEPEDVASTLVHEMVHLWQHQYGRPGRRGYHNQEWATKMEALGLIPSDTGQPDGKRVGQRMTHYIKPDGRFIAVYRSMPPAYLLPWRTTLPSLETAGTGTGRGSRNLVKYSCQSGCASAWGKPGLSLVCGLCGAPFGKA